MSLQKIKQNELFINQVEFNPKVNLSIYNGKTYLNNQSDISGAFTTNVGNVPIGSINLYEINVDRNIATTGLVYPFITKNGSLASFKTTSTTSFNSDFSYGDTITGSYPLSASITRDYYSSGESRSRVTALKNTLNYYNKFSQYYQYSASFGDKATIPLNLISIPSIFYGNAIDKGSVKLDFYISGTLIGTVEDKNNNGELIQTAPYGSTGSGSVAGVVLYTEGFIILTGSWGLETGVARNYLNDISNQVTSSWLYYGTGLGNESYTDGMIPSSSFSMQFKGVNKVPIMTALLHAKRGEINNSTNPTFISYNSNINPLTSSRTYVENNILEPANVVSSSYIDTEPFLEKTTFISSIKLYDENKNVIGIAKLAKPVRKTQDRDLTFKIRLDL